MEEEKEKKKLNRKASVPLDLPVLEEVLKG